MNIVPSKNSPSCSISNHEGWHWGWAALLISITLITLAIRYALPIRDSDFWFHMVYGKYFVEFNTLIADHTIFSWTPTTNDTIYCTWLPDIFLYLLHKVVGLPGIFIFRYICMLVLVAGCYSYARSLRVVTHPLTWLLCLLGVIMSYTAAYAKPEMFSYVFMILLVWNWWHIRSVGEKAWHHCYLFPIIILVWANSHGGFVFGAVFLVLIGLGELLNTWLAPSSRLPVYLRKHLAIGLLLAALMPFVTPYGYHYPAQLIFDLIPTAENVSFNQKIAAYESTFAYPNTFNFELCADLVIVFLLLLLVRSFKQIEWSSLLTNLTFAFLYTRFYRTTFYWVPVFLFSGIYLLSLRAVVPSAWKYCRVLRGLFLLLAVSVSFYLGGDTYYRSMNLPEKYQWMGFGISDANPVSETKYIKKYFSEKRIGNTYIEGAYLLWTLWPENTVFFDARHFPYRNWSDAFFKFSRGNQVQEMIEQFPSDLWCIGLNNLNLLTALLDSGDWKLAFYGKNSAVLVRMVISIPGNTARVSKNMYDQKNLPSAIECLTFACYIKDWKTAKKLLTVMQDKFTLRPHKSAMRWANQLYDGMFAYYSGNYSKAIGSFEFMLDRPTVINYILTSCYHYLSSEAWQQENEPLAYEYARKAWDMIPETPYSLYNLGTIIRQREQEASLRDNDLGTTNGLTLPHSDWRPFMTEFLLITSEKDFAPFRRAASAMLEGRQHPRSRLLIPPEPKINSVVPAMDNK